MNMECGGYSHQETSENKTLEHQLGVSRKFVTSTPFKDSSDVAKVSETNDSGLGDTAPFEATLAETSANMPEDPAPETEKKKIMELLIASKQEETDEMYTRWSATLKGSEDFEGFVVDMLDDMLKKAYVVEKSLRDQKDILKNRVLMLSQSLAGLVADEGGV